MPETNTPSKSSGGPPEAPLRIKIHSLPKVVFFYPTWIVSLVCAIASMSGMDSWLGNAWMTVFVLNLFVIAYDFTEERTIIALLGGVAIVLALVLGGVLGTITSALANIQPVMNDHFYWTMFVLFSAVFLVAWVGSRLDYWIIEPNEVVHRYGLFRRMKRFSTESLRWDKVIPDVMERLMLGTGQIILTTPHEKHPIIIDHVMRIGHIDDQIARILGVKQVVTHRPLDRGDEEY
jgi:hypothetical protein